MLSKHRNALCALIVYGSFLFILLIVERFNPVGELSTSLPWKDQSIPGIQHSIFWAHVVNVGGDAGMLIALLGGYLVAVRISSLNLPKGVQHLARANMLIITAAVTSMIVVDIWSELHPGPTIGGAKLLCWLVIALTLVAQFFLGGLFVYRSWRITPKGHQMAMSIPDTIFKAAFYSEIGTIATMILLLLATLFGGVSLHADAPGYLTFTTPAGLWGQSVASLWAGSLVVMCLFLGGSISALHWGHAPLSSAEKQG